jgi:hypothetical protein
VLVVRDAEHAADALAVDFCDPPRLSGVVVIVGEVGDDACCERFERGVPTLFARIQLRVGLNDPAEVAGLAEQPDFRRH